METAYRQYVEAWKTKDIPALRKVIADDYMAVNVEGALSSKQNEIELRMRFLASVYASSMSGIYALLEAVEKTVRHSIWNAVRGRFIPQSPILCPPPGAEGRTGGLRGGA